WALPDRRQLPLEGRALSLEPRRQSESLAERLLRFVDEEPRAVGRDLEQDPVGQAVGERAEVLAVLHRRRVQADLAEALEPDLLLVVVCGAPRNVVNRSRPDQRELVGGLGEPQRRVLGDEPRVELRVADRDHVAQGGLLRRIESTPQAVGNLWFAL